VDALTRKGALVWYDFEVTDDDGILFQIDANGQASALSPPEPKWLREVLGVDSLRPVTRITAPPDDGLDGADLEHLTALLNLEILVLHCPKLSDANLRHLRQLRSLRHLVLYRTPITDDGLRHLENLTRLEYLRLVDTEVTDAGLRRIKSVLPKCEVEFKRR
jgi:hypothetical protein